jgi:hypothetical protein
MVRTKVTVGLALAAVMLLAPLAARAEELPPVSGDDVRAWVALWRLRGSPRSDGTGEFDRSLNDRLSSAGVDDSVTKGMLTYLRENKAPDWLQTKVRDAMKKREDRKKKADKGLPVLPTVKGRLKTATTKVPTAK